MFYRFQTFKDDSFPSTAISNQNRALHITLHSPLNRNDPSFWSSQIAVDSHFVCVWCVCICVSSRPFTLSSLLRSTEPHRDPTVARCRSASVCFSLSRSLVFGSSRKQRAHWASIARFPPLLFLLHRFFTCRRYSAGGRGRTVTDQAAMNMAFIGDADPFTASIPATKVELTVSCRWVLTTFASLRWDVQNNKYSFHCDICPGVPCRLHSRE